jgi:hypothetical protein
MPVHAERYEHGDVFVTHSARAEFFQEERDDDVIRTGPGRVGDGDRHGGSGVDEVAQAGTILGGGQSISGRALH